MTYSIYYVIATKKDGTYQRFSNSRYPKRLFSSTNKQKVIDKFNKDILPKQTDHFPIQLLMLVKGYFTIEEKYYEDGELVQHDIEDENQK